MSNQQRRLGRGLEALLGRPAGAGSELDEMAAQVRPELRVAGTADPVEPAAGGLLQVSVKEIDSNPFQPRRDFDETAINELAASLQQHGLLQPLVVRRQGDRFQLVAGERRLRAAVRAGWSEVPVQVREADDRQMTELAIVENLQRRDLNPLEKAASFQQYLESYGCTQEELAGRLKVDRSTIANLIRLLELPINVQDALRRGAITQGHARALLPLGDDREQLALCQRIETESLSVRATEELVQDMIHASEAPALAVVGADGKTAVKANKKPRDTLGSNCAARAGIRAALGTKVSIRQTAKGGGKIVVQFTNVDEFDRLREILCGPEIGSKPANRPLIFRS